jgi:hypothetical protein
MSKPLLGLVLGAILGVFDGLTALVSAPNLRPEIMGIVIGSTFKGLVVGVLVGWFARKVDSLALGIGAGLVAGAAFAALIGAFPASDGRYYFWEIVLPGTVLGIIVGYATQRYGRQPQRSTVG